MKLYGIATSLVPKKDDSDPNIIAVTCTPIAVDDGNQEVFEELDEPPSYRAEFDMTNTQQVMDEFVRFVDTLDHVVGLQRKACDAAHIGYRPVVLHPGEDSRHPMNLNTLHVQLFGGAISAVGDFVGSWKSRAQTRKARKARTRYLEEHQETLPDQFMVAYQKLPDLLSASTLEWGSHSIIDDKKNWEVGKLQKTHWDIELSHLKRQLDKGDRAHAAHDRIKEIAHTLGEHEGKRATKDPSVFQLRVPKGYLQSEEAQKQFPKYSFFQWDKEYEQAFHDGFNNAYQGLHSKRFKLYLDQSNPPFTDPCADMIRDQLQIAKGIRHEETVIDQPDVRKYIADAAEALVEGQKSGVTVSCVDISRAQPYSTSRVNIRGPK